MKKLLILIFIIFLVGCSQKKANLLATKDKTTVNLAMVPVSFGTFFMGKMYASFKKVMNDKEKLWNGKRG